MGHLLSWHRSQTKLEPINIFKKDYLIEVENLLLSNAKNINFGNVLKPNPR